MRIADMESLLQALRENGIVFCEVGLPNGEMLRVRWSARGNESHDSPCAPTGFLPNRESPLPRHLVSNGMGIYRQSHPLAPPNCDAGIHEGSRVEIDDVIGFLQVDDLVFGVPANVAGKVSDVLVQDGDLVGYGQALFRLS